MTPELASALAKLPDKPGVYLMKDARGDVVYVGKAQSLRSRVRSYWQKQAPGGEIHRIRSVIDRVVSAALHQAMMPHWESTFLTQSMGSAQDAAPGTCSPSWRR